MERNKGSLQPDSESSHQIRDSEAWDNVELFLVSAVMSILLIRAYLKLAGYPSIGLENLHIAHLLWGGLLMLAALMILLIWWNPAARRFGAFLAGLGFGTFADEIGKFVTHDNDYFFKPTAMILYTLFMVLFLAARSLIGNRALTGREEKVNRRMREMFPYHHTAISSKIDIYFKAREKLASMYRTVVLNRWFKIVLTAGFIVIGVIGLAVVTGEITGEPDTDPGISIVQMVVYAASLACIWVGIWFLRTSRLKAYIWFKRSVLINIFITQIFVFYRSQFAGLGWLAVFLLLYFALHFMITREKQIIRQTGRADS
ncbi:MAG: hypothetical protein ACQERI_04815 [Candidatus Krumholzibacteriota bacterium]